MKRILSLVLLVALCLCATACGSGAMSYDEYVKAPLESEVTIETYVQAHQSWWQDKVTVYTQDKNGGYFLYELQCSEEDAAKLVPGQKIRVTGKKTAYAGEVEILGATFEFIDGDTYIADAKDLTAKLGTDELYDFLNQKAVFKGLTVVSIAYQNGARGSDIYVTLSNGTAEFSFCVESYLTSPTSETYLAVEALAAGDTVDVEGFVYYWSSDDTIDASDVNVHITAVTKK